MSLPVTERSGRIGYPVPPGPSILEIMWGRLVEETETLLDGNLGNQLEPGWEMSVKRQIGVCIGMAEMVAILLNPYNPSVDEVRTEVMRRIGERTSA